MKRQILSSVVVWMYVLLCPRDVTKLIVADESSLKGPTNTFMECPDQITPGKTNFTCKVHNSFNTSFCPGTEDVPYKLVIELSKPNTNATQTVCKIDAPIMACSEDVGTCGCQELAGEIVTIKTVRDMKVSDAGAKMQCFSFCLFTNNTVAKDPGPSKGSCEALKISGAAPPPAAAAEGPNIGLIAGLVAIPIVLIVVFFLVFKKKPAESAPPPPSSAAKPSEGGEGEEEEEEEEEEGEGGEEGGEEEDA